MQAYVRAALALIPMLAVVLIAGYLLYAGKSPTEGQAIMILLGALIGFAEKGASYYLGSSQGSSDKTQAMIERDKSNRGDATG